MKKKILHIIVGLGDGGAESSLARLCLFSKANEHVVISMTGVGKYGKYLKENGIKVYCLNSKFSAYNPFVIYKISRLVLGEKPSVVQTWMYHSDLLGSIAARIAGVKSICWNVRSSTPSGSFLRSAYVRVSGFLSRFLPSKIVFCAEDSLRRHTNIGYEIDKSLVIPNGYDLNKFHIDNSARSSIRKEFGFLESDFVLGNVARFSPSKDHANLIAALKILSDKGFNFRCLLVGFGVETNNNELKCLISQAGLSHNIVLAGPRDDINAIMNALDLHVLPSSSEAFPNVIAESMACGVPNVSTNVGDANSIIGDTGFICDAKDPENLSSLIQYCWAEYTNQDKKWQSRKVLCRERITDNFSISSMVEMYEDLWNDICE